MKFTKESDAASVANIVEQTWLTRYPWPQEIVYDRGSEFMTKFASMCRNDHGLKQKPMTTRNPQANSILERIHQKTGNMMRAFRAQEIELDEEDPWSGILSATMFTVRSTVHTGSTMMSSVGLSN